MFFTNHSISREDLQPGDHICCRRYGLVYAHHGIYMGEGKVAHYSDAAGIGRKAGACVSVTTLDEFLNGDPLRRVRYSDRRAAEEALDRARQMLERGGYSVIWNNCEHFATYCVTGRRESVQVKRAIVLTASAVAGMAAVFVTKALPGRRGRA